jgi:hypothetical protein
MSLESKRNFDPENPSGQSTNTALYPSIRITSQSCLWICWVAFKRIHYIQHVIGIPRRTRRPLSLGQTSTKAAKPSELIELSIDISIKNQRSRPARWNSHEITFHGIREPCFIKRRLNNRWGFATNNHWQRFSDTLHLF